MAGGGEFKFGVVILAAGSSRRMGRPKLLLEWSGTTVLGHLLRQWNELRAAQIGVVCAADGVVVRQELDRLAFGRENVIANPAPDEGMLSSVRCAAAWTGWKIDLTHWVIALGDQPHLREKTLRALVDFATRHPAKICQPLFRGEPKHPVILPKGAFLALREAEAANLKEFLAGRASEQAGCDLDDEGLDLDLDTPEDYERARKMASTQT